MIGVELLHAAELRGIEQCGPVDPRRLLLELRARPHLGSVLEVFTLLAGLVCLGDLGLKIDDTPRGARRVGIAGVLQDRLNVRPVLVAEIDHLRVAGEVVIALGQTDAALHQVGQLFAGRRQPLRHENAEQIFGLEIGGVQRVGVRAEGAPDGGAQLMLVGDARNGVEIRLGRRHPRAVDRVGVGIGLVVIGDHPVRAAGRVGLQDLVEQLTRVLLALLVGDQEAPDTRPVRRDWRVLDPGAVCVFVEIVAGHGGLVHPRRVDAEGAALLLRFARAVARARVACAERQRGRENQKQRLIHGKTLSRRVAVRPSASFARAQAAARRAARLFDQRTIRRHERTAHREQNRYGRRRVPRARRAQSRARRKAARGCCGSGEGRTGEASRAPCVARQVAPA